VCKYEENIMRGKESQDEGDEEVITTVRRITKYVVAGNIFKPSVETNCLVSVMKCHTEER